MCLLRWTHFLFGIKRFSIIFQEKKIEHVMRNGIDYALVLKLLKICMPNKVGHVTERLESSSKTTSQMKSLLEAEVVALFLVLYRETKECVSTDHGLQVKIRDVKMV